MQLNVDENDKYEAIKQLNNALLQCSQQETLIITLKLQIDNLNQIISDQQNELLLSRDEDKSLENEDLSALLPLSAPNNSTPDINCLPETLSEEEIESKFATLALSYRTDKFTLQQRLDVQKRQRDVAEHDATNELHILRNSIQFLNQLLLSSEHTLSENIRSEVKELFIKIEHNIEVVAKTNLKISSRSELYGAVKQEEKFSAAFDVILLHAENLKTLRDTEHRELEDAKKVINAYTNKISECNGNNNGTNSNVDSDSDYETHARRSVRSFSPSVPPQVNMEACTQRRLVQNANPINMRYLTSNLIKSNRSRRRSMPANPSPLLIQAKNGISNDYVSSHLEITCEEKGDCDSDCSDSEVVANTLEPLSQQISETVEHQTLASSMDSNQTDFNENQIERENLTINRVSDQLNETVISDYNNTLKLFEFHYISDMYNYYIKDGLTNCFKTILASINSQQFRLIFAILLLILAVIVVILSVVSVSPLPSLTLYCEWKNAFYSIFSQYLPKDKASKTQ